MFGKVLFVGDINVDIIMGGLVSEPVPDREITCESYDVTVGSSAVICAAAYAFLGGNTGFAGLVGSDQNGKFMLSKMKEFNIDTALVEHTDRVTTGVTLNLIRGTVRTQITYPGTISTYSGRRLTSKAFKSFKHIHFAGPYQEINFKSKISSILKTAKKFKITTSLDPQWDLTEKWKDMSEWLPNLTYLFVNSDEAVSITKQKNVKEALKKLSKLTACPIVKLGKAGALGILNGKIITSHSCTVKVKDTAGAGDNFDAGFLFAALNKKMNFSDSLQFANAAGARSCMFAGGTGARSSYNQILKFKEEWK